MYTWQWDNWQTICLSTQLLCTIDQQTPLLYQVIFTITGREEVDLLDFFFIVCGVPGSFSACALLIILTGWLKCPERRLHLMSHTITLPSLAPEAKTTEEGKNDFVNSIYKFTSTFDSYLWRPEMVLQAK